MSNIALMQRCKDKPSPNFMHSISKDLLLSFEDVVIIIRGSSISTAEQLNNPITFFLNAFQTIVIIYITKSNTTIRVEKEDPL